MHNELTNLLPPERVRALGRDYVYRLVTVALILVTVLAGMGGVLLIPTYVTLQGSADAKRTHLAAVESTLSATDDAKLSARLTLLSNNASTLIALSSRPSASSVIQSLLRISRPGITLSGLTYTPATEKTAATLLVQGSAATRDALRGYQLALQGSPMATSAALPVSAYARDTDISFIITVTLAP